MRICESLADHRKGRLDKVNREMDRIKSDIWPIIEFVQVLPIYQQDQGTIQIHYDAEYSFTQSIHISVEEYPYQQIVEEIAGPIHQKFGWFWHLFIEGTPKQPQFILRNITPEDSQYDGTITIRIQINEGEVKTCRVEKRVLKVLTLDEVKKRHFEGDKKFIYEKVMICEEG